jgi:hypothetical protein
MVVDVELGSHGMTGVAETGSEPGAPVTDTERWLAELWADVLDVPAAGIRRTDNFFGIGGSSRTAARLVIVLERRMPLGEFSRTRMTVGEFARTSTLADLAELLDRRPTAPETAAVGG